MLYAGVISARLAAPLRAARVRVFERRACPMPFACVSGLTKSCNKNQNFAEAEAKDGVAVYRDPEPGGSRARQNFGKAI
jgi:hypothetical protein